jgi:signal transduction histidine kinase
MGAPSPYILIVDDKPTNLKVLSTTLTDAGFEIAVATDGTMALQRVAEDSPELIILDVLMPEMDGFETCRQLKENPEWREIPVIFMTALSDTIDKVRGFSLGAVDYITKPFETEEVLARVNNHLQIRLLTKALAKKNEQLSEAVERLKKTQKTLISQEKLATMGALTAGIAHELRNPLNFIKNYAEGSVELSDDLLEEIEKQFPLEWGEKARYIHELVKDLRENSRSITRHTQQAENVIQDTLLQATDNNGVKRPADLNALLDRSLQLVYKSKYIRRLELPVTIQKDYDESIGQIPIVSSQIGRAFINLLDNAFYAMAKKREQMAPTKKISPLQLCLTTQRVSDRAVRIRIRDEGIGISPDVKPQLFRPFFSTKPIDEGTGLGLYLTRDIIVNHHGGTLNIESELGVFTEFIIEIPIASSQGESW